MRRLTTFLLAIPAVALLLIVVFVPVNAGLHTLRILPWAWQVLEGWWWLLVLGWLVVDPVMRRVDRELVNRQSGDAMAWPVSAMQRAIGMLRWMLGGLAAALGACLVVSWPVGILALAWRAIH